MIIFLNRLLSLGLKYPLMIVISGHHAVYSLLALQAVLTA